VENSRKYTSLALRYFFIYFMSEWVLNLIFTVLISNTENPLEPNILYTIVYSILQIYLMFYLVLKFSKNKETNINFEFNSSQSDIFSSMLIGFSLGILLPIVGNMGYLFESTFVFEITETGITRLAEFYQNQTIGEFTILTILGSVFAIIARELFFRGLLFDLFRREMNVTMATIQLSFFFSLMYLSHQYNEIDLLSLLITSIVLCYITFLKKSLLPAIIISICIDIPILMLLRFDHFFESPETYLVFNSEFSLIYLSAVALLYLGFKKISQNRNETYVS
jgi:membrane protease YdiL (CAAX protease family)